MKYLELIKGQFTADHEARAKQLEPYVAYSEEAGGVMYTFIPEPVVGPADNEIWYTSNDGKVVTPYNTKVFGANIISNTYENDKGVITFDNSVTSVGLHAFYGHNSLTSITIPDSVISIGAQTFWNCYSLNSVAIPNSVTSIGQEAFQNCQSLASIVIPDSVTSIGEKAFMNCKSLTSMVVAVGNTMYDSRENCNAIIHTATNTLIRGCQNTIIPRSVTSIGESAFNNCPSLTSIIIPNGVTSIGGFAFCACSSLTSITFEGTMDEWNSITKGSYWNYDVPATYVQCTDGQVAL